ncbi:hypothetical protein WA026_022654 [Henosepilachna vigintioctopunctata]|uniref:Uncharacterized protein n=1 Tax=Henosepilachna vigintioctopunctata TaxID=420089 RepID=A0AAW1U6G2_9CUCU
MIDLESQLSFITEEAEQRLGLARTKIYAEISGISESDAEVLTSKIEVLPQPRFPSTFRTWQEFLNLPKLTSKLPQTNLLIFWRKSE